MGFSRREFLAGTVALGAGASLGAASAKNPPERVEIWGVLELAFNGPEIDSAVDDVDIAGVFESSERSVRVNGFHDGGGVYRIRFSPPQTGRWTWRTSSNIAKLNSHSGELLCTEPSKDNHGPVRVTADGYHFVYSDGVPFRQIGTTAYSWALQSDEKCDQTLEALRKSPFNKIRMCVFPNVDAAATHPFAVTGHGPRDWDPSRPDPAYFQRFEERIRRLGELGIEADVILFHPYDEARGYNDMGRVDDERYVRYVAARFGAFRNVWWSMANEYDKVKSKSLDDWDHLFQVLLDADPHDRLRSIHQLRVYYDHRKPWITHASIQNGSAVGNDARAEPHRNFAQKAVIFDEVCYEGNTHRRWANLTGEELVERFWWGTVAGTYVGHGETYSPDGNPDYSFLGQGGELVGTSPPRLAFLRKILEEAPAPGIEPIHASWDYHLGGKPFEYYLRYFGSARPSEWPVELPGSDPVLEPGYEEPMNTYRADIIDTWNMTITPVDGVFRMTERGHYDFHDPSRPTIDLPGKPYIAVRFVKV